MKRILLITFIALSLNGVAQEEENLLPFVVSVTANGEEAEQFTVTLYKGNEQVAQLPPSDHGAFELELDLNEHFSIRVSKDGYRDKVIAVNTVSPVAVEFHETVMYTVDLEPIDRFAHADPFYLDFPSGLVQWDEATSSFAHSEHYLADIQLKIALLSAQAEAK